LYPEVQGDTISHFNPHLMRDPLNAFSNGSFQFLTLRSKKTYAISNQKITSAFMIKAALMTPSAIKIIASASACLLAFLLFGSTIILNSQAETLLKNNTYEQLCFFILACGLIALLLSWVSAHIVITISTLVLISLNLLFIFLQIKESYLVLYFFVYLSVWGILFVYNLKEKHRYIKLSLLIEAAHETKNTLSQDIIESEAELESYVNRYSNYFTLREVVNQFATTLSIKRITRLIVDQTLQIIDKGDSCLLYLTEGDEDVIALVASKKVSDAPAIRSKTGSVFDQWALKSRQNIIVTDTTTDVRFDYENDGIQDDLRSLIATPLLNDGKVSGALRVNSKRPACFNTDDLRLLSIISVLAASSIGNAKLYQKTEDLAIRDSLTNLFVHRYFKERLKEEHKRSLLSNTPLSLLMCDLDNFKQYNDTYGHSAGDLVLRTLSKVLTDETDENMLVARYGGEEFAILMPNIHIKSALAVAETIRQKVSETEVDLRGVKTHITLSIGVSSFPDDTLACDDLIAHADKRLYEAKRKGRNQIC